MIPLFLRNETTLHTALLNKNPAVNGNYLFNNFIYWLSSYAEEGPKTLQDYFTGTNNLDTLCRDFIKYCFTHHIQLDAKKTLDSFDSHNQLSDNAVKNELQDIQPKDEINLLGFGCNDGSYEKSLAQYLIDQSKTKKVNLFGFDPFAQRGAGIQYLEPDQLTTFAAPKFDLITARWALHHVALKDRWQDFIKCINRSNPGSSVLIVEHGYLGEKPDAFDKKVSDILNATFDIVANIGLRPSYFTDSAPNIGANFFIHYLEPHDFKAIKQGIQLQSTQKIYDVGPGFPNQTICTIHTNMAKR